MTTTQGDGMDDETPKHVSIDAVPVIRDANGWWLHPDAPWEAVDEQPFGEFFHRYGYSGCAVHLQYEMDEDQEPLLSYMEQGSTDISAWTPTPPTGDGWFLLAICDGEDGPFAYYLRRLSLDMVATPTALESA